MSADRRRREAGYSLVALMASVAVMLIMMTAAIPSWRYLMKNDREEELIARGGEIADAIMRYQRRNGNALPPSLEALVKGKFLRRAYKDPMTKDGKWRLIRPGEAIGPTAPGAAGGSGTGSGSSGFGASSSAASGTTRGGASGGSPSASPGGGPSSSSSGFGSSRGPAGSSSGGSSFGSSFSQPGGALGGFQGVASTSTEKSLRVFNGRTRYNEWIFLPGQPRVVGRPVGPTSPQPGGGVRPQGTSGGGATVTRP
jgi:type II secretory pathway pseudopilin PulG